MNSIEILTFEAVEILKKQQKSDADFFASLNGSAGTFCAECHRNTYTGLYPFWHRFARTLCRECGLRYIGQLKNLGAVDL